MGMEKGEGADGEGVETDLEEVAAGEVVAETGEGGAAGAERRERSFGKNKWIVFLSQQVAGGYFFEVAHLQNRWKQVPVFGFVL